MKTCIWYLTQVELKANWYLDPQIKREQESFKILKQISFIKSNTTYKRLTLCKNGKKRQVAVHRIVAEAFLENENNFPIVNHIDNNGENNNVENLEWCTQSHNLIHAQKQGRLFNAQSFGGTKNGISRNLESLNFIDGYIGTTINDWHIISIDDNTISFNRPRRIICKCLRCNREQSVLFHSVKIGRSRMCKSCAQKQRHLDKINTQAKIQSSLRRDVQLS